MTNDLETFLEQYRDLVLVTFWEEDSEVSAYMAQLLDRVEPLQQVPILKLKLDEHRDWAHNHGVHGTPALIAYYQHQPLVKVIGRVTPEELLRCFQKLQVESPVISVDVKAVEENELTPPSEG